MQEPQSVQDPLLQSLVFLTKVYGHPYQGEALISGLPLADGKLTPLLFSRAAERAELSAHHASYALANISSLLLPCVLLLKGNNAAVLLEIDTEQARCRVMLPSSGEGEQWLALDKLNSSYAGQVIFTKPKFRFDARSPKVLDTQEHAAQLFRYLQRCINRLLAH